MHAKVQHAFALLEIAHAQPTQFLTAQTSVIGKGQHGSVANRLLACRSQKRMPVLFVRNPRQLVMPCDHRAAATVLGRWVSRTHPFFHQVRMEQTDYGQL